MKRRRPWLRWLALGLSVEACLWLFGACRPYFDVPINLDRSPPILLFDRSEQIVVPDTTGRRVTFFNSLDHPELEAIRKRWTPPREARRTQAGQLLDDHGRVLLNDLSEDSIFAYSEKHDLLVWSTPKNSRNYGLNIRSRGKNHFIRTWNTDAVQIRPNGTIWLSEYNLTAGIAVISNEGVFLGWRAGGYHVFDIKDFCEVGNLDQFYVKKTVESREFLTPRNN